MADTSVIVNDLYGFRVTRPPFEADAPLLIDTDAVLPGPIPCEWFQAVGRRYAKIIQRLRVIQHPQLPSGDAVDVGR
jgi:hypothetical protein